ncbi:MAG: tetratricopeptide repeat protein [Bacteriovoracaceae bacterium]|nr:tetratricopeptide repeat protein [Bacteriovoracaceae bacterium]
MKRSLITIIPVLSILVSCAHQLAPTKDIKVTRFDPYQELKLKGDYTLQQVENAKASGPKAMQFLSSELYFKAMDASLRGEIATAVHFYKFAYELNPSDDYLVKKYAVELIKAGEIESVQTLLEAHIEKNSSNNDDGINLLMAGVYAALDKSDRARVIYSKIINQGEQVQEACLFLSRSLASEKKFNEGQKTLDKCAKKDPSEAMYTFYKGKLFQEQGKRDLAFKYYRQSLKIDPDFFQATLAIGSLYEEKEDFLSALKEYKKYVDSPVASNPHPVLSRLVQMMFTLEMNKDVVPYAEMLVSLDDSDLTTKVRLGLLYVDSDDYQKAIAMFKEVLEVVPESDKVIYYLAALYQEIKENELALQYFSKIQESSPLFADSLLQRGELYSQKAKVDFDAKKEVSQEFINFVDTYAQKFDDLKVELGLIKATFFEEINSLNESVATLKALKNHKKYTDGHDYYLASILEKNGSKEEARSIVLGLIKKDPNNAHALNFLGYSYLEQSENLDLAYTYISKAVKLRPEDGYIRDSMAWYFYKVGKYDQALIEANKAYELVNNDVTITKHLGMIYEKLNRFDRAKAFYTQALTQADQHLEREELLKNIQSIESTRKPASAP